MCRRVLVIAIALTATVLNSPALAITAGEVLQRMTDRERFGYITGAVDLAIHLEQVSAKGPTARSNCIQNWYYGKDAPGPRQVVSMFSTNQERTAVGLIKILIDRACGQSVAAPR